MAAVDTFSASGSSSEGVYQSGDSETDTSGSLAFTPRFPSPDLFPYHAIGGSLDPRNNNGMVDSSSNGTGSGVGTGSYCYPSAEEPGLYYQQQHKEAMVVEPTDVIRQVSMEGVEIQSHSHYQDDGHNDNDNESSGNCSDLTDSTHGRIRTITSNHHGTAHTQLDDYSAWQIWQSTFQPSKAPLLVLNTSFPPPPLMITATMARNTNSLLIDSINPRHEQHMQLHKNPLPAISEDLHEDNHRNHHIHHNTTTPTTTNSKVPIVPLRRDHSSGGTLLEDQIAALMKQISRKMTVTDN